MSEYTKNKITFMEFVGGTTILLGILIVFLIIANGLN